MKLIVKCVSDQAPEKDLFIYYSLALSDNSFSMLFPDSVVSREVVVPEHHLYM